MPSFYFLGAESTILNLRPPHSKSICLSLFVISRLEQTSCSLRVSATNSIKLLLVSSALRSLLEKSYTVGLRSAWRYFLLTAFCSSVKSELISAVVFIRSTALSSSITWSACSSVQSKSRISFSTCFSNYIIPFLGRWGNYAPPFALQIILVLSAFSLYIIILL